MAIRIFFGKDTTVVCPTADERFFAPNQTVDSLLGSGIKNITVDLSPLPSITSDTIGELLTCTRKAEVAHAQLRLINVSDSVRQVLSRMKVTELLNIEPE